jgi:phosphoribosylamine--glycine ligase
MPWIQAMIARRLHELPAPRFAPVASLGLGLFARGYPNYFPTGGPVRGIEDLDEGVLLFHSATENPGGLRYTPQTRSGGGFFGFGGTPNSLGAHLRVMGGQPLMLVTTAATLTGARGRALINAERVMFDGRTYRENVGEREFS